MRRWPLGRQYGPFRIEAPSRPGFTRSRPAGSVNSQHRPSGHRRKYDRTAASSSRVKAESDLNFCRVHETNSVEFQLFAADAMTRSYLIRRRFWLSSLLALLSLSALAQAETLHVRAVDGTGITVTREGSGPVIAVWLPSEHGLTAGDRDCLLYTSPSPRDVEESRMPSSA